VRKRICDWQRLEAMLARFENLPTFLRNKRQGFFGNFDCRVGKFHQTSSKQ
jgi:hypothetical protein